jgi:CheY-like chemotaxis protein
VAQQRHWVSQIRHGADHLLTLINEILDLGRIEAGHLGLDCAPVSTSSLVDECLALTSALAQARGVQLGTGPGLGDSDAGLMVLADRRRLKQVLLNLISNAIKYNRSSGSVEISAVSTGDQVVISVRDTGPGLSEEACARLFKPFERLGAEKGEIEGTGIGLALCRQITAAMGGTIGVDSRPGRGSRFWVSLPEAHTSAATPLLSAPSPLGDDGPPATARERTVLYIDDNAVNVMLMEIVLADMPALKLVVAQRPQEGLELALIARPDLILLDIHMPQMDGFEVLQRLRACPPTAAIPVIAVSANAMSGDVSAAMDAGFVDYLVKPLDLDRVLDVVRCRLEGREPMPSLHRRTDTTITDFSEG